MKRRGFLAAALVGALASGWMAVAVAATPVVIDVRTADEFAAGHVAGAINVPHDQIGARIASLVPRKDTPVVLYCRSGRRSGIALDTLRGMGYTKAENYGGYEDAAKRLAGGCTAGSKC